MNDEQIKELGKKSKANVEVECGEKRPLRPNTKGTERKK